MVAQTREIKGTVSAVKGGPAAGITVTVKGTKRSVASGGSPARTGAGCCWPLYCFYLIT